MLTNLKASKSLNILFKIHLNPNLAKKELIKTQRKRQQQKIFSHVYDQTWFSSFCFQTFTIGWKKNSQHFIFLFQIMIFQSIQISAVVNCFRTFYTFCKKWDFFAPWVFFSIWHEFVQNKPWILRLLWLLSCWRLLTDFVCTCFVVVKFAVIRIS